MFYKREKEIAVTRAAEEREKTKIKQNKTKIIENDLNENRVSLKFQCYAENSNAYIGSYW